MRTCLVMLCFLTGGAVAFGQTPDATQKQKTPEQERYVNWFISITARAADTMVQLNKIRQLFAADPNVYEDIDIFLASSKSAQAEAHSLLSEWKRYKHPYPFHATDRHLGNTLSALVEATDYLVVALRDVDANATRRFLQAVKVSTEHGERCRQAMIREIDSLPDR